MYTVVPVLNELSQMHVIICLRERYDNVFPCKKEHVDDIRYAVKDVNPSSFVVMWVCLCHN